jgi:hypothetical protein
VLTCNSLRTKFPYLYTLTKLNPTIYSISSYKVSTSSLIKCLTNLQSFHASYPCHPLLIKKRSMPSLLYAMLLIFNLLANESSTYTIVSSLFFYNVIKYSIIFFSVSKDSIVLSSISLLIFYQNWYYKITWKLNSYIYIHNTKYHIVMLYIIILKKSCDICSSLNLNLARAYKIYLTPCLHMYICSSLVQSSADQHANLITSSIFFFRCERV